MTDELIDYSFEATLLIKVKNVSLREKIYNILKYKMLSKCFYYIYIKIK